jgi:hypothetical protein
MAAAVIAQMTGPFAAVDGEASSQSAWEGTCALTKKQRFIGFGSCLVFGMLISFLSFLFLTRPTSFALLYTLGNIVSLASTGFLIGFLRQLKYAFAKKRIAATLIFIFAMIMTLFSVLYLKITILAIFCVIIQFAALVWYTASYIRGWHSRAVHKCCQAFADFFFFFPLLFLQLSPKTF